MCRRATDDPGNWNGVGDIQLVLVMKDGIYQLLCLPCADKYRPKRRDVYGGTPFWARKGY